MCVLAMLRENEYVCMWKVLSVYGCVEGVEYVFAKDGVYVHRGRCACVCVKICVWVCGGICVCVYMYVYVCYEKRECI